MEFQIDETRKQIAIFLPMTTPTGKARVKRPIPGQQAEPVATRRKTVEPDDYIEWQIAYETSNPDEPSALAKVQFSNAWRTAEILTAIAVVWRVVFCPPSGALQ